MQWFLRMYQMIALLLEFLQKYIGDKNIDGKNI